MGRKPEIRLASSACGFRARERRVRGTRSVSLRADTAGGRFLGEVPFAPDLFLPEQHVAGVRRDSTMCGEKALLLAVLMDGIRCFQERRRSGRPNPRALAEEAEAWITAVDDEQPCSFQNICAILGLNPRRVRARLLATKPPRQRAAETFELTPKIPRLHAGPVPAGPPSPLTAGPSGARQCGGSSREPTPRRADPHPG